MEQSPSNSRTGEQARQFGTVFWVTVALSLVFVGFGVFLTDPFSSALTTFAGGIISGMGWTYMLVTTFFLAFALYLAFGRYGKIRLGRENEEPEFGLFAWFAMLFQAGMGIGLVFWMVSEPVTHYADPPLGEAQPGTPEAANLALRYAFFHWTLHPWAIYAVVGLAVAYFSYRRGMTSLRISSVFYPLLGDRVNGPVGKAIDVFAILATLIGIAASLGSGTLQIDAGLGTVFGLPIGTTGIQLAIIGVTMFAYMLSASTPIEKGVNILSQASIYLATLLLIFFIVVGPTLLQLSAFTEGIGAYLGDLVPMSLRMSAFDAQESAWLGEWTIFFWATWIAWAPYVGVFIARISRGRTIRQFVLGVLVAPSLFTIVFFAVFGAAGIQTDERLGGALSEAATNNPAVALFDFFAQYPLAIVTSILAIFLVWIFFVAGADAGTIVLGSMSAGGTLNPSRLIKLTWGAIMAGVAAILLLAGGGGINAIQQAQIVIAAPFMVLMLAICFALFRALRRDYREERRQLQEVLAHDNNVEEKQMQEIMRRFEKGEPVGRSTPRRDKR